MDETFEIEVDGALLHTELVGPPDAPVLYYLHGGPGYSAHSFRDLVGDDLSNYLMVYSDARGGGRSPAEGRVILETLADDVVRVLGALELPAATLLAHGFGALAAVSTAVQHPERVERLVLVNPWVDMPLLARTLQRSAAVLSDNADLALPPEAVLSEGAAPDPETLLDQAFAWLPATRLFDTLRFPRPAGRLRLEHSDAGALPGEAEGVTPEGVWSWSVRNELARVEQATVVLVGRDDGTAYPDQAEVVLERVPHALFSLLETGHYPWLDDPETFLALLDELLRLEEVK